MSTRPAAASMACGLLALVLVCLVGCAAKEKPKPGVKPTIIPRRFPWVLPKAPATHAARRPGHTAPVFVRAAPPTPDYLRFPWPPPKASATHVVPAELLRPEGQEPVLQSHVEAKLRGALDACGYSEKSYYAVPQGFAMVTRLEQFNKDGTSKPEPKRWAAKLGRVPFWKVREYLRAVFTARRGLFRIIVFVVTSVPFSQKNAKVTREEAQEWLRGGMHVLPGPLGNRPYTPQHYCVALIYEFEKSNEETDVMTRFPGLLKGLTHLRKSRLWAHLEK